MIKVVEGVYPQNKYNKVLLDNMVIAFVRFVLPFIKSLSVTSFFPSNVVIYLIEDLCII